MLWTYQVASWNGLQMVEAARFNYEAQHKGFHVYGHEKPDTVTYQKDFVKKYLMEEVQLFCWIQIEQEEAERLE